MSELHEDVEDYVDACFMGDVDEAESSLDRGVDVNSQDIGGHIGLVAAAESGHSAIVALLLQRNADVQRAERDGLGETALIAAARCGRAEIAQMLLDAGADTSLKYNGATALQCAEKKRKTTVADLLRQHQAQASSIDLTVLPELPSIDHMSQFSFTEQTLEPRAPVTGAAEESDASADATAGDGAEVHVGNVSAEDVEDYVDACFMGDVDEAESSLDRGVDVNSQDIGGHIGLVDAAAGGHSAIVALLLQRNADVQRAERDGLGETALIAAARCGRAEIAQMLLDAGADTSLKYNGATALQCAEKKRKTTVADLLRQHQAQAPSSVGVGEAILNTSPDQNSLPERQPRPQSASVVPRQIPIRPSVDPKWSSTPFKLHVKLCCFFTEVPGGDSLPITVLQTTPITDLIAAIQAIVGASSCFPLRSNDCLTPSQLISSSTAFSIRLASRGNGARYSRVKRQEPGRSNCVRLFLRRLWVDRWPTSEFHR
eukprot:COSAG02_NODE_1636_length_11551_cov_2.706863_4_plen_487_part_00